MYQTREKVSSVVTTVDTIESGQVVRKTRDYSRDYFYVCVVKKFTIQDRGIHVGGVECLLRKNCFTFFFLLFFFCNSKKSPAKNSSSIKNFCRFSKGEAG